MKKQSNPHPPDGVEKPKQPPAPPKLSESTETAGYVDDLVLLVRRLVHRLNQCSPTDPLVNKALDYLRRNGHQSSIGF